MNAHGDRQTRAPLDTNGLVDKDVASLPGIDKLADILKSRYNGQLNYANVTGIWAQVLNEMNLAVSRESLRLSDHFLDWAGQLVAKNPSNITLYDVSNAASLLLFRDHAVGKALQIQNGPIVTSLVDSFRVALNHSVTSLHEPSSLDTYKDKKMVLYSTHEVVIIFLMNSLELLNFKSSFEDRFDKYSTKSHLEQVINGIRVPTYGISLRFELVELKNNATGEKLPVVRAYLYDNEDAKFSDIQYQPLKLGKACQKLFKRMYPNQNYSSYNRKFQINADYICPHGVFEKVTSNQLVNRKELVELCKVQ